MLVKIGVYVFARLFLATFALDETMRTAVAVIAAASALVSAGAALVDTGFKRIVAYSTVSQIGFIFLGLATGSTVGVVGALLYILMHGLAKAGLFLSAGIVEQNAGTKDIRKLGGLLRTMPITAVAFLFCAVSVMGIPPTGGFVGKDMVVASAVDTGHLAIGAVVMVDTRRLADCFPSIDYFERNGMPFVVAVNCFDDARRYPTETMRAALNLTGDIPLLLCDARERASSRDVLVALVEHAVNRLSSGRHVTSPG